MENCKKTEIRRAVKFMSKWSQTGRQSGLVINHAWYSEGIEIESRPEDRLYSLHFPSAHLPDN
jgi:hypothetical protein